MLAQIQLSLFYFSVFSFSYTNTHFDESVNVYCKPEFLSKYTDRHCYVFLLCFVLKTCEQRYLLNNCISKVRPPLKQKRALVFAGIMLISHLKGHLP